MAYEQHDVQFDQNDVRTGTASGDIDQWACLYMASSRTIAENTLANQVACGIALDDYDDGDKGCNYAIRGKFPFISEGTVSINDPLTPSGTAGYFRKALQGEKIVGRVLEAATAGLYGTAEFDFGQGGSVGDEVVYYNSAITADISPTLENAAGTYLIKGCYIAETAGNAITGGLNIATTTGGNDIAAALTVAGSTKYWYVTSDMATPSVTLTENDEIFIEDASAWNSTSIIFKLCLERIY